MQKSKELAIKLEKSEYKELGQWIQDFALYFSQEYHLLATEEAQKLIQEIELRLEEGINKQTYFHYYLSSYFKPNQGKQEVDIRQAVANNVKQLCNLIYTNTEGSEMNQNQKQIIIQEYFSLHPSISQFSTIDEQKFSKIKESHNFKSIQAQDFYMKYLKEHINQQGQSVKIFWTDFKQYFTAYLKDQLNLKFKTDYNLNDIVTYLKKLIDFKEDNAVDLEEIDCFFSKYLNAEKFSIEDLYKITENHQYKPLNQILVLEILKFPTEYNNFYSTNGIKYLMKPYQDRIALGRKAEAKINTLQMFPEEDSNISRQQIQISKDDLQNFYVENLHSNASLSIRVTSEKQNVRKGFTYVFPKKSYVFIEEIVPQHERFQEGVSSINPDLDSQYIELKANLSQLKTADVEQQQEQIGQQIQFKYNNIRYVTHQTKFTIGKSLSDDIQVESAEENGQLVFEYIKNYGWIVYEPKATKGGVYFKVNAKSISNQEGKKGNDVNQTQIIPQVNIKFQVFDGMLLQLFNYEWRLTFKK